MGNGTARTFALSGGAGASLLGAVVVVLIVLGAILAFDGSDRSATGSEGRSVAIEGAPEAAAQSVAPATEAVAARPAPIPELAAPAPPLLVASPGPPAPPAPIPGPPQPPPDVPDDTPGPGPVPDDCLLGDVLPECLTAPDRPTPGGVLGEVAGGLDGATESLLGTDLGLQELTSPVGQTLDGLYGDLQPPVSGARGAINGTAAGIGTQLDGLGAGGH